LEHIVTHPKIGVYGRSKKALNRILKHPSFLEKVEANKNKILGLLFLDSSLTSLLTPELLCFDYPSLISVRVRVRVSFLDKLNAKQLSAIPTCLKFAAQFIKEANISTSMKFHYVEENYTSPAVDLATGTPCLFFDMLNSCQNGASCTGFTGVGHCICPSQFEGTFCHRVRPTPSDPGLPQAERWLKWAYMAVAAIIVSSIIIFIMKIADKCRESQKEKRGDKLGRGLKTRTPSPYVLPAIQVVSPTPKGSGSTVKKSYGTPRRLHGRPLSRAHRSRDLGASFAVRQKRSCGSVRGKTIASNGKKQKYNFRDSKIGSVKPVPSKQLSPITSEIADHMFASPVLGGMTV